MLAGYTGNEPLAAHTTLKVGGAATYFAIANSEAKLRGLLATANEAGEPVTMLGGGSNVLVADTGIPGCVIKNAITGWQAAEDNGQVNLTVGAGEVFDAVVEKTVAAGWWGLENLSHIPGSVGATPIQNVGAYGTEVADCIVSVTAIHRDTLESRTFTNTECQFGYRDSWFKSEAGRAWVITGVTFALSATPKPNLSYRDLTERFSGSTPTVEEVRAAVIAIRSQKFPDWHTVGTAGSFFKNPIISQTHFAKLQARYPELPGFPTDSCGVKVPLGWILDKVCHLRGVSDGPVGTYQGQALVLVNTGDASATNVTRFAKKIVAAVHAATDITIDWEVTLLG